MLQTNGIYLNGNNSTVQITGTSRNEVKVFISPIFGEIRVITDGNGNPLFCLVDLCTSIGIVNHRNVKNRLDVDDVHLIDTIDNLGRTQQVTYVTESGMYDVILRSDSPKSKPFKKWVTNDVLPTIRKTGSYSVQPQYQIPQSFSEALMLAAQQQLQIEEQQKQIEQKEEKITELTAENEELQKQSEYTRVILQNKGTTLVTQIAQDYGMSAMKFNAMLRNYGIQYKMRNQWILYAKYLDKGYVQSSTHNFTHKNGRPDVSLTTEWTQRGRLFLYNFLKGKGVLPSIELR